MIYIDDSLVTVGGWLLPGLLKSIEVEGKVLYEEIEIEGRNDRPKQVTGYADGQVFIDLILHGQTEDEVIKKLSKIQRIFRKPNIKTPYAYNIVNKHVNARDINVVVLKSLTSKEAAGKGYNLTVNLEFFEYIPITITAKKTSNINASSNKPSDTTSGLNENYKEYLQNDRGVAPTIKDKSDASPAKDNYKKPIGIMRSPH